MHRSSARCLPSDPGCGNQEEEARTRGTPVTLESFRIWKVKFDREIASKKVREEEEKSKGSTPKEREERKRAGARLTGRSFQRCAPTAVLTTFLRRTPIV